MYAWNENNRYDNEENQKTFNAYKSTQLDSMGKGLRGGDKGAGEDDAVI